MPAITIADIDLKVPLKPADSIAHGKVITTNETTAYILKPFRSPKSKRLKSAVVFVPRLSHFDIENERSSTNEFRVRLPPNCIE